MPQLDAAVERVAGRPRKLSLDNTATCMKPEVVEAADSSDMRESVAHYRNNTEPGIRVAPRGVAPIHLEANKVYGRVSSSGPRSSTGEAMKYTPSTVVDPKFCKSNIVGHRVPSSTTLPASALADGFRFGKYLGQSKDTAKDAIAPELRVEEAPLESDAEEAAKAKRARLYSPHGVNVVGKRSPGMTDWSQVRGIDATTHSFGRASTNRPT